jgi:hypothetical protein
VALPAAQQLLSVRHSSPDTLNPAFKSSNKKGGACAPPKSLIAHGLPSRDIVRSPEQLIRPGRKNGGAAFLQIDGLGTPFELESLVVVRVQHYGVGNAPGVIKSF